MVRIIARLAVLGAALCLTVPAIAAAPPPARAVPAELYSGRWYEIARLPNDNQRDCQAPTSDFVNFRDGVFRMVQVCHRGAPNGPARTISASARILPSTNNAKIRVTFMGVINQEYWILDRADDGSWAIMATPGGNYVWLLARRPTLDAATRARLVARLGQLGYPVARLQFPAQQ